MDAADGYGVAAEVHDKLAVAVDADYIAFLTFEGAGEDTEFDVVLGEFEEGVAEEGDAFGLGVHQTHKGLHDAVGDGRGETGGAITN